MTWLRRFPWIPGAGVALALWLWVFARLDFAADAQENIDLLWQSLGSGILSADPIGSIRVLHIQPPLLNAIFALDLATTPDSHYFLALLNVAALIASIAFLVDGLRRIGVGVWVAMAAGIAYALLPGTVAYATWVYNVTLTGLFAMLAVWGVALVRTRPILGAAVSAGAFLGLVLTRSTFAFPVLVIWLIALGILVVRRGAPRAVWVLLGVLVLGGAVQAHYLVNFGQVTMSSWGGQNVINAARTSGVLSVSPNVLASINEDPCRAAAWDAFTNERLNVWDPGGLLSLPSCSAAVIPAERGAAAWDAQFRPGSEELNLNWRYGLAASGVWTEVAVRIVQGDPLQLVRMAVNPPGGVLESGVARYLSRSENYRWVLPAAEALPGAGAGVWVSTVFAPVAWLVVIIGWGFAVFSRRWRSRSRPAFWFASGLLVFHISASTLLEYAEAMRFRAEVEPVLMFIAVATGWWIWEWFRNRVQIASDTSPSSALH